MARLTVQHCVVNTTTRQYGPHPTSSDLLGVNYFVTVPADTEFPRLLGKLELFVRFFARDLPPLRVRVTMTRLAPDGSDLQLIYRNRFQVTTARQPGLVVIDRSFKLMTITLPGTGVYAIRVLRRVRRPWEATPGYRVLKTEYVAVMRAP